MPDPTERNVSAGSGGAPWSKRKGVRRTPFPIVLIARYSTVNTAGSMGLFTSMLFAVNTKLVPAFCSMVVGN